MSPREKPHYEAPFSLSRLDTLNLSMTELAQCQGRLIQAQLASTTHSVAVWWLSFLPWTLWWNPGLVFLAQLPKPPTTLTCRNKAAPQNAYNGSGTKKPGAEASG